MRPNVKARMVHLVAAVLAMQRSGDRRDIYHIVYEPENGMQHSHEFEVYANPEFVEVKEEVKSESDISEEPNGEEGNTD